MKQPKRKILLAAWAAINYDPPPSMWVLRKWIRQGEISPMPVLVGRSYYVEEDAIRVTVANVRGRSARQPLMAYGAPAASACGYSRSISLRAARNAFFLRHAGLPLEVHAVANGRSALAAAKADQPDLTPFGRPSRACC